MHYEIFLPEFVIVVYVRKQCGGAVGTGAYPSVVDACDKIIKMRDEVYKPDEEFAFIYDKVYREFDALYPKLKENWKSILNIDFQY